MTAGAGSEGKGLTGGGGAEGQGTDLLLLWLVSRFWFRLGYLGLG